MPPCTAGCRVLTRPSSWKQRRRKNRKKRQGPCRQKFTPYHNIISRQTLWFGIRLWHHQQHLHTRQECPWERNKAPPLQSAVHVNKQRLHSEGKGTHHFRKRCELLHPCDRVACLLQSWRSSPSGDQLVPAMMIDRFSISSHQYYIIKLSTTQCRP